MSCRKCHRGTSRASKLAQVPLCLIGGRWLCIFCGGSEPVLVDESGRLTLDRARGMQAELWRRLRDCRRRPAEGRGVSSMLAGA